jgi:D-3-phosphoglycerate dehydrogenase / 2-oxoglutarate reductase
VLEGAKKLKVIGRAGIGVDNVDIPAATARGVIVMNTPFGNSITTAEHAIALMLALARRFPPPTPRPRPANGRRTASWASRSPARRSASSAAAISARSSPTAPGLKMKVIAYDPFLSPERAQDLGVEKVELDELLARADFITLHTPLTDRPQHHRRRNARQDQEGRAHHQLRARRLVDEAACGGARFRPCRRRGARRVRRGAGDGTRAVRQ